MPLVKTFWCLNMFTCLYFYRCFNSILFILRLRIIFLLSMAHEAFHFYVGSVCLSSALLVRESHSDMLIVTILQEVSWDVGTVKTELKEEVRTEVGLCIDRSV